MKERIVVAMSGGVDSSVAAVLLKEQGYEVIGITMCFNLTDSVGKNFGCCGIEGVEDARRVCRKLEIKHYVLNTEKVFKERVIKDFCRQYLRGRTPNPCILCNKYIKFGVLLKRALSLNAKFLATGHYARIVKDRYGLLLRKARDLTKDQSYFLYCLSQYQLKYAFFPLGDFLKSKVRDLAKKFGLSVANKSDSQEICFLRGADYRAFLKMHMSEDIVPGLIVDNQGDILGRHKGIAFYTIGQREGLGIAKGYPLYVTSIDFKKNRIVVGTKEDVCQKGFLVKKGYFVRRPIKNKIVLKVKIRYNHNESVAEINPLKDGLKVRFMNPQFAVTPGQTAVFYNNEDVFGGGTIERILN